MIYPSKIGLNVLKYSIFFSRDFQPMVFSCDDAPYHKTKIPINFSCRQGLNPRSFIQLSEILLVELNGIYK